MSQIDAAMVLAAGFGTRMGALTRERPKPLLPVRGRPLIDHALDLAAGAGVGRAVVNLHYLGGMIREHLAGRTSPEVQFSEEAPEILDTGGGIRQALPLLGPRPFLTLNSDAVWVGPNPLVQLCECWDENAADALLLFVPRDRAIGYTRAGDFFLDEGGGVPKRRGDAPEAPFVYSGAQIIRPDAFADALDGPLSLNIVWDALLAAGRLRAVTYPGAWVDVGTPEGLAAADAALKAFADAGPDTPAGAL